MNAIRNMALALASALVLAVSPATAGDLCNAVGNVFGGDAKGACEGASDQVTPILQQGVVVTNTIGGAAAAAYFGVPPQLGAEAGACYAQLVNSGFAGNFRPACVNQLMAHAAASSAQYAQSQMPRMPNPYPTPYPDPYAAMGQQYYPPAHDQIGGPQPWPTSGGPVITGRLAPGYSLPASDNIDPSRQGTTCQTGAGSYTLPAPGPVGLSCGIPTPQGIVPGTIVP